MPIEFKDSIDVDGNIKASQAFIDSNDSAGTIGQILTSTGSVSQWSDVVPGASTLVEIACKNTSGGTITVGTPVYQTGTVGATAIIEVAPANALISAGNYPAIGLLKTTLVNNDIGFVVITGALTNIITSPIDGTVPTTGDTIYLKSGGGLTLTKPTGEGNAIQNMGLVGKVSTGTAGSITVSSIMRANDVPNLPLGHTFIGTSTNPTTIDLTTALDSKVDGTGTTNHVSKWTGATTQGDSLIFDDGTNVGIGTTTPIRKLHVNAVDTLAVAKFHSTDSRNESHIILSNPTSPDDKIKIGSNETNLVFTTNWSEKMRITSAGNVGIGTTAPSEKLEVSGNIKAEGSVQVGDNTDSATASNVGAMRYTTDGSASYVDMCMEVASGTYEWVNIVTNTF